MSDAIRLRKTLDAPVVLPELAAGIETAPLWQVRPIELHALLRAAYANGGGSVGSFDEWWWPLVEDDEFDPELVIIATAERRPIGMAQCWTSGFIKDLVVAPGWRNRRLGAYLLHASFARLHERAATSVDLKVQARNQAAQRFYHRHGMWVVV